MISASRCGLTTWSRWLGRRLAGVCSAVLLPAAVAWACAAEASSAAPVLPERPRVLLDTAWPTMPGKIIAVKAGGDLRAALEQAQPGDTIALEPGAVFRGNFTLKK